jgi:predicted polyphosphate/ATP-dependent NAD kinase
MSPPLVGIIANPVSARDIRRIISHAGNMPISDRANVILRLMAGMAATGVSNVVMMPEKSGICGYLNRDLKRATKQGKTCFPDLDILDMPVTGKAVDSSLAANIMSKMGVAAIVVLGGDGTHRVVVRECGNIPIASVSTGTNNAFPEMREPTITGLAVGLAVSSKIPPSVAFRPNKRLDVQVNDRQEMALVDVAIVRERYIGARAIWRTDSFKELFVTFGEPGGIGMSSIAGLLAPVTRAEPHGLHIIFSPLDKASFTVNAPIAPGLMAPVGIDRVNDLKFDQPVSITASAGSLALDGEREISFSEKDQIFVVLREAAFKTIDVSACMAHAATENLFVEGNISNLNIHK